MPRRGQGAEEVERLRSAAGDLGSALKELRSFLHKANRLLTCSSVEEVLEVSDELLLETVDFIFYRFYLSTSLTSAESLPGPEESGFRLVRAACPEDTAIDWDVLAWAMRSREVVLLPTGEEGGPARSLLVVPLLVPKPLLLAQPLLLAAAAT